MHLFSTYFPAMLSHVLLNESGNMTFFVVFWFDLHVIKLAFTLVNPFFKILFANTSVCKKENFNIHKKITEKSIICSSV